MIPALRPLNAHRPKHDFSGLHRLVQRRRQMEEMMARFQAQQEFFEMSASCEKEAWSRAEAAWNAREEQRQRIRVKVLKWVVAVALLLCFLLPAILSRP